MRRGQGYELTLTARERQAFDWVGDRYNSGEVARILQEFLPDDVEWNDAGEITFDLTRKAAREINDLAEKEDPPHSWPCFGYSLTWRLKEFCSIFWD